MVAGVLRGGISSTALPTPWDSYPMSRWMPRSRSAGYPQLAISFRGKRQKNVPNTGDEANPHGIPETRLSYPSSSRASSLRAVPQLTQARSRPAVGRARARLLNPSTSAGPLGLQPGEREMLLLTQSGVRPAVGKAPLASHIHCKRRRDGDACPATGCIPGNN